MLGKLMVESGGAERTAQTLILLIGAGGGFNKILTASGEVMR